MLALALLAGCQSELNDLGSPSDQSQLKSANADKTVTFYSNVEHLGNGNVKTYYTQSLGGMPVELGIILNEAALSNLPKQPTSISIPFHMKAGKTNFTHVLIDWNPNGHEPEHIYDKPHFDFHFYFGFTNAQRLAIGPNDTVQFANVPDSDFWPPMYWKIPGGVPQMGAHWVDLLAPEFNGGMFTKTFIFGSYDGRFIFFEPMITRDYLLTHPNESIDIRQPAAFQSDGWYPMKYSIRYVNTNPKQYIISLTNLVYREAYEE
jgi:hypothetical protein